MVPFNKEQAVQRMYWLKRKLLKSPEYMSDYVGNINTLISRNYAVKIPNELLRTEPGKVWYIPHHGIYHPRKPNKLRVVYDCSAKYKGKSLNDFLIQGPDLTNSLLGVLTRFRESPIAFMADIEAMFHQVKVSQSLRNFLRFLWWPEGNLENDLEEYQMTSHPFGAISSPSCANFALHRTAEQYSGHLLSVADTINRNFYVDDCLKSCETESKAIELANNLISVCAKGGFNLTKFISNSRLLIQNLPEDKLAKDVKCLDLDYSDLPSERALGVNWQIESDKFGFKIELIDKPLTRRGILSTVASLFDTLGFVAPLILHAKRILRNICEEEKGWDDPISDYHKNDWLKWRAQLPLLENFSIERCLKPVNFGNVIRREVHLFADASSVGYGCVAYQRIINDQNQIHCSFLFGKARLAPLKTVTIPRLELTAATVAARLKSVLIKELDYFPDTISFWTDSITVLRYIKNEKKRFHVFVTNRVTVIRELSLVNQWFYVSSENNPADQASRGLQATDMINDTMWLNGPDFLWKPQSYWPEQPVLSEIDPNDPEVKTQTTVLLTNCQDKLLDPTTQLFEHYSDWHRLKRATVLIVRFRNNLKKWSNFRKDLNERLKDLPKDIKQKQINEKMNKTRISDSRELMALITVEELNSAEHFVLKFVQQKSFPKAFTALSSDNTKRLTKDNSIYRLDPVYSNGLIRVGGRLHHANIIEQSKHPIILPKNGHIVTLITRYVHKLSGHSGRGHVIARLREHYWIINSNSTVRYILSKCVYCRELYGSVLDQKMADLPADRVNPSLPFSSTGIDLFGPFIVKEGRKELKRYGVIFTCLVIRAVHIEIVNSLDTSSFINSLRRFIARRGPVQEIRSDNGTNFHGAERELRQEIIKWNQNQIHNELLQRNVKWNFSPPTGSHHGGVWERQIRTIRRVLNGLLQGSNTVTLNEESLRTIMCEVESIVNSRPLTFASSDPNDLNPLTPNSLLNVKPTTWLLPPGEFKREDMYRRYWKQVQYLVDSFWKRWQREYLLTLQQRSKWTVSKRNVCINDIVLLVDDNAPRNQWKMGRVTKVYYDCKNLVKSVCVKTQFSEFQRPISKLVLILP